jgi:hypothetical protein
MPSSRVRTTFGASTPWGSASFLIRHIMSVALSPHSWRTKGAMLMPVSCSALSERAVVLVVDILPRLKLKARDSSYYADWSSS